MREHEIRQPFVGIRVLDMTHVLAGPFCAYQLAVLGADVIKIEPVGNTDCARGRGPDGALNAAGLGINYLVQGANKRAISLDVASLAGRAIFLDLVDTADVLIENYRAGALASLGLGPATLQARNPRLIICSITGFGQLGERAAVNAYDNVIQAASGLVARTRSSSGEQVKPGASFVDYATGYAGAFAVSAALFQRERSGQGQVIDCSMFDTALTLMAPEAASALYEGTSTQRPKEAGLGRYDTADGVLMLGAFNVRQNRRLWEALDRPEFSVLESWEDLWAQADPMREALRTIMPTRTAADWEIYLQGIGVPAERVRSLEEAVAMPHLRQRAFFHRLDPAVPGSSAVTVPVAAFSFAEAGPKINRAPPRPGEHTDEILSDLGYSHESIAIWRAQGVVAGS